MTLRVSAASIAPDLRFAAADVLADPSRTQRSGNVLIRSVGCLPESPAIPRYLRYTDREAVIVADGVDDRRQLERCLGDRLEALAESGELADLGVAVIALDAVDGCFRDAGLWPGNIYLAGTEALAIVLELAGAAQAVSRGSELVARELAALELAYLFPIASKFRGGLYDGQIQYRLNGWGRALALRLTRTQFGSARGREYRRRLGEHIANERKRYESFLGGLDVARQEYLDNPLDDARALPIPILV